MPQPGRSPGGTAAAGRCGSAEQTHEVAAHAIEVRGADQLGHLSSAYTCSTAESSASPRLVRSHGRCRPSCESVPRRTQPPLRVHQLGGGLLGHAHQPGQFPSDPGGLVAGGQHPNRRPAVTVGPPPDLELVVQAVDQLPQRSREPEPGAGRRLETNGRGRYSAHGGVKVLPSRRWAWPPTRGSTVTAAARPRRWPARIRRRPGTTIASPACGVNFSLPAIRTDAAPSSTTNTSSRVSECGGGATRPEGLPPSRRRCQGSAGRRRQRREASAAEVVGWCGRGRGRAFHLLDGQLG